VLHGCRRLREVLQKVRLQKIKNRRVEFFRPASLFFNET
jgi:hypothetical protein